MYDNDRMTTGEITSSDGVFTEQMRICIKRLR